MIINELIAAIESLKQLKYNGVISESDYALIISRIISYQLERNDEHAEENN